MARALSHVTAGGHAVMRRWRPRHIPHTHQPLQAPPSFQALPEPTPNGANLVDQDPRALAAQALGGRVSAERTSSVPGADAGLVGYAGRNGVQSDIRATLAAGG